MSARVPIALFIGGAHKAGTTALFRALCQHPELCGHAEPELTFFVEDDEYRQGFESRAWRRYPPPELGARRFVAKHVKLFYRRLALERLREYSPEARLVLVLRNPVDRAHSAYWHACALGREELPSFELALAAEEERLKAGRSHWHDTAYLRNGLYERPLEHAFEVFGRERVRVYLVEELREPGRIVRELHALLGVEAGGPPDLERGANRATRARSPRLARIVGRAFDSRSTAKRVVRALLPDRVALALRSGFVRWNTRPLEVPAMAPETRERLLERFRESNQRVAGLLGRDLSAWGR